MLEFLLVLQAAFLVVGVPAALLYGRERLKNLAREATDRALADRRHEQDRILEAMRADHERRLQEFGLYAQRQHSVYAELYKRARDASDWFASTYGLSLTPDFSEYGVDELREYFKRHRVLGLRAREVLEAYDGGDTKEVGRLMSELNVKVRRAAAERAFNRMKDYEARNELYLSDDVRARIHDVRHAMARFSASLRYADDERRDTKALEKREEVGASVARLFSTMRVELLRGDAGGAATLGLPAPRSTTPS